MNRQISMKHGTQSVPGEGATVDSDRQACRDCPPYRPFLCPTHQKEFDIALREPRRIQRKRLPGWRLPQNAVCVTRPGAFGNPFKAELFGSEAECVAAFYRWLRWNKYPAGHSPGWERDLSERRCRLIARLPELTGKDLACFCTVEAKHCHADILLDIANDPKYLSAVTGLRVPRASTGQQSQSHDHDWSPELPVVGCKRPVAEQEVRARAFEKMMVVAYIRDRAEQYKNNSGSRTALVLVAEAIEEDEHAKAFGHGELDDLVKGSISAAGRDRWDST